MLLYCHQDTFEPTVSLLGLEPYTNYTLQVSLTNFYTEQWAAGAPQPLGAQAVFQTQPGGKRPASLVNTPCRCGM